MRRAVKKPQTERPTRNIRDNRCPPVNVDAVDFTGAGIGYPQGTNVPPGCLEARKPVGKNVRLQGFQHLRLGDPSPRQPCIHRARSKARDEDIFGCRTVFIFIFGFVTCSLSRTPRPPAEL